MYMEVLSRSTSHSFLFRLEINCWLRGISHGVPAHHSHSLNRPARWWLNHSVFVSACIYVCVNICMPARQGSTIKITARKRAFLIASMQLPLFSSWQTEDKSSQSATFTFRTPLWQTERAGWDNIKRQRQNKSKISMGDRQTKWHKLCYVEMVKCWKERDRGRCKVTKGKRKLKENRRKK